MAFVTGDAIYSFLGMLAVHPGLKDPPRIFLMTGEAIADLLLSPASQGREQKKDGCQYKHRLCNHDSSTR
jgi:hypothetical protein